MEKRISQAGFLSAITFWGGLAFVALLSCELGARVDDWFFEDVPLLDSPSYEELFLVDEFGKRRGRPGARWKHVQLNNLGMRGAEIPAVPRAKCSRWMFLGASETFGEPSLSDAEYPARIHAATKTNRCLDILNTAFPGIAPQELTSNYRTGLAKYKPEVVFVYASTHFYLADLPARPAPPPVKRELPKVPVGAATNFRWSDLIKRSRFWERLRDTAEIPAVIQRWRLHKWIDDATSNKPAEWQFKGVPEERLIYLEDDLKELIAAIRESGAEPVLMTHAVRVSSPPRTEDESDLFAMRVYVPQASEPIIAEFEYAAADRVRKVATESHVQLIDVARAMNGRRDQFVDLVHFSSTGHAEVAALIQKEMGKAPEQAEKNVIQ